MKTQNQFHNWRIATFLPSLFLFLVGYTNKASAQTPICPPVSNCSQTVTAHVVNIASNVDLNYAQSLNFNFPQRYFCLGDPIYLRGLWNPSVSLLSARWDVISASCTNLTLQMVKQ
jgi:hypothetical protein